MTKRPSSRERRADAFARLLEAAHEGVFIGTIDVAGGHGDRADAVNPHMRRILGAPDDTSDPEIVPFSPRHLDDTHARELFVSQLAEHAVTDYPLRLRRFDGTLVWVEVTARARPRKRAHTWALDALIRDVSERRRVDDQSRDLYQQLLQAEKMASLGQTISGVAHELNNPLATILTWAERIKSRAPEAEVKRGIDIILGETERASRIVRNLLTFARKRQSTRAMIDLNRVVTDTLDLRAYEQRVSNIDVIRALASGLPHIFADAHQIQQVLLNLVINAEQAMLGSHGRGTLIVRTWHDPEGDFVALEVSDDGPGVPVDSLQKVFDPFYTTKDVGQGTGLGLSVAYAIIEEHGGRIRVDTTQEGEGRGGATFVVELPIRGLAPTAQRRKPQTASMEAVRGASVLVVEDEPALADAVVDALTDAGLQVDHAGDGEAALARVEASTYDAIVCDLKMPRVDGMTFYRALAAARPTLARRVVFVTGDVLGSDAERFFEDTGCRWLTKPFRFGDLLRVVREVLG